MFDHDTCRDFAPRDALVGKGLRRRLSKEIDMVNFALDGPHPRVVCLDMFVCRNIVHSSSQRFCEKRAGFLPK